MIELIQFPWSPYCLVQKCILDYSGVRHKVINIPPQFVNMLPYVLTIAALAVFSGKVRPPAAAGTPFVKE